MSQPIYKQLDINAGAYTPAQARHAAEAINQALSLIHIYRKSPIVPHPQSCSAMAEAMLVLVIMPATSSLSFNTTR